jgi:hypothetical protein
MLSGLRRRDDPPTPATRSGVRPRVLNALVVSANDASRSLLVARLMAAGFHVEWAADAKETQERAEGSPPDVVVVERLGNEPLSEKLLGGWLTIVVQCVSGQHFAEIARIADALKGIG